MIARRLIVPVLLAGLLLWGSPPPVYGKVGGSDVVLENAPKQGHTSVSPSISGGARLTAPQPRQAEPRQSWLAVIRDLLRYLLGDSFPLLNGRLR